MTPDWSFDDYELYCISLEKFEIIEKLGAGSIGDVYLAEYTPKGRLYALKFIKIKHEKCAINGIKLSKKLIHKNLIRCYGYFTEKWNGEIYIISIMEYFQSMDIFDMLLIDNNMLINNYGTRWVVKHKNIKSVLKQLVDGLNYLHDNNIIHRDIKLENVLINYKGEVKITDYDFLTDKEYPDNIGCGTPCYSSPEILNNKIINYKTDLWSLGVILYIILDGDYPFGDDYNTFKKIIYEEPSYANIPFKYLSIVSGLLIKDKLERIGFSDLYKLLKEL